MKEKAHSRWDTADKIIKTIYFLGYILWNVFLIVVICTSLYEANVEQSLPGGGTESNIGYVFSFLIVGVVYGSIGNAVIACIALVGLIVAICHKANLNRKKSVFTYVVLILLPVITQGLIILVGMQAPLLI